MASLILVLLAADSLVAQMVADMVAEVQIFSNDSMAADMVAEAQIFSKGSMATLPATATLAAAVATVTVATVLVVVVLVVVLGTLVHLTVATLLANVCLQGLGSALDRRH